MKIEIENPLWVGIKRVIKTESMGSGMIIVPKQFKDSLCIVIVPREQDMIAPEAEGRGRPRKSNNKPNERAGERGGE